MENQKKTLELGLAGSSTTTAGRGDEPSGGKELSYLSPVLQRPNLNWSFQKRFRFKVTSPDLMLSFLRDPMPCKEPMPIVEQVDSGPMVDTENPAQPYHNS